MVYFVVSLFVRFKVMEPGLQVFGVPGVVQGAEVKTDHYLLVGICRLQFRPRQPHRPSKDNSDISSLSDENVWNVYQQKLQNMLSNSQILLCVA